MHKYISIDKKCICRLESRKRQIWDVSLIILVMWNLGIVIYSSASNTIVMHNIRFMNFLKYLID